MSPITTHVLDTSRGKPAASVPVVLSHRAPDGTYTELGRGQTDGNGRLQDLLPADQRIQAGVYRLVFDVAEYFRTYGIPAFFPEVSVLFHIRDPEQHHHVPLLLAPYGYSTYRGS